MRIDELIGLAEAKQRHQQEMKREYERIGDAGEIARIESELFETERTLQQLRGLVG